MAVEFKISFLVEIWAERNAQFFLCTYVIIKYRYLLMYSENMKIKYMNGENIDGKKTKI